MSYAHLPNAPHIYRILAHVRYRPEKWAAARDVAWAAARGAAWDAVWADAQGAALGTAQRAALGAALDAAWGAARGAAMHAARDAIAALVIWDDASVLLDQDPDVLRMAAAAGNHAAILILPAVIAMSNR